MKVISVVHNADILVDTYQFHDSLKKEVIRLLGEGAPCISQEDSNVKETSVSYTHLTLPTIYSV